MKNKIKRSKLRIFLEIFLTMFFAFFLNGLLKKDPVKMDIQLEIRLKTDRDDVYELFVNNEIQRLPVSIGDNKLVFKLPKIPIKQIRLKFGQKNTSIVIKRIRLRSLFKNTSWQGNALQKLISFTNQIRNKRSREGNYIFSTDGDEPYLVFSNRFYPYINRLSNKKFLHYFLFLSLLFLFFCFLHFQSLEKIKSLIGQKETLAGILVFSLLISIPVINEIFSFIKPFHIPEKRVRSKLPQLRFDPLIDFFHNYEKYYKDHFIYRNYAVHINSLLKVFIFRNSPIEEVLLGKDHWLFYAREGNRDLINYYRNGNHLNEEELQIWVKVLKGRKKWLKDRGIHYLFVVVPNKNTIYQEYMPNFIRKVNNQSRLDQLFEELSKKTDIDFIDLRATLIAGKKNYPVYDSTNSHWNDYGAFLACHKIISHLNKYFKPLHYFTLDDYIIREIDGGGGDLAMMLSLHKKYFRENKITLAPKKHPAIKYRPLTRIRGFIRQSISTNPDGKLSTALSVHDSFMHQLKPFLSCHFKKVVYIWDWDLHFFPKIIERIKPVVVIDEMAERALIDLIPKNPVELNRDN